MVLEINRIINGNVFIDGNTFLGKVDEALCPNAKAVSTDHKPLGMIGTAHFPSGIEIENARLTFNSVYLDAVKKCANFTKARDIQIRGNLETFTQDGKVNERAAVCYFKGKPLNTPGLGTLKQQENATNQVEFTVTYTKLEVDGETIYEHDILNAIQYVDGIDLLAKTRENLGL
jgi:P2 family phage contractile tail tube protein